MIPYSLLCVNLYCFVMLPGSGTLGSMIVLGIESSCDETSAALVQNGDTLLSVVTNSSMDLHVQYGGVVPEIAARSHIECINGVIEQALQEAGIDWSGVDAIAVTYGAGLGGSLLVGVLTARTLAIVYNKPLYAINHVEGHVYANFLTGVKKLPDHSAGGDPRGHRESAGQNERSDVLSKEGRASLQPGKNLEDYALPQTQPTFPTLALIVSGGHSQLVLFRGHFDYTLLGQTRDDAIGEAFDKVAKILGLPYPGGPSVERRAKEGDPHKHSLPKSRLEGTPSCLVELRSHLPAPTVKPPANYDFSFSGLKTATLRLAQELIGADYAFPSKDLPGRLSEAHKADIAASFQHTAIETVVDKTVQAYEEFQPASVIIAGGVAASPELRRQLAARIPIEINYTDPRLCTDNGAMIATLGCFHVKHGRPTADPYSLEIAPNLSM